MRWVLAMAGIFAGLAFDAPGARALDCGNGQTQSGLNECAGAAYHEADAALNEAYRQVAARLEPTSGLAAQLVAAQRAWLAFRDAECGFEAAPYEGGSIRPLAEAECLEGVTRARTAQFQAWLTCDKDGDLSCPLPRR